MFYAKQNSSCIGVKLEGKTALITGANAGIGFETALDFAGRGAKVLLACRNAEKANEARRRIIEESNCAEDKVVIKELDLASLKSVRRLADDLNESEPKLDILINNAGVMMCPQSTTEDGFETHFQVNYLSHFLLTNLLLRKLKSSACSRVVNVTSELHKNGYIAWDDLNLDKNYDDAMAYYQSKLMNIMFTRHLLKLLEGSSVTAYSVHPGIVKTELTKHITAPGGNLFWKFKIGLSNWPVLRNIIWKTPKQGALTIIYCALAPELGEVSGKYYSDCRVADESEAAKNDDDAERLWKMSEELIDHRKSVDQTT